MPAQGTGCAQGARQHGAGMRMPAQGTRQQGMHWSDAGAQRILQVLGLLLCGACTGAAGAQRAAAAAGTGSWSTAGRCGGG